MHNPVERDMSKQNKPHFVYVIDIGATPEQVWQALTDPNVTEKYWYGFRVAANGKVGDYMTATDPAGKTVHHDAILESDPPRRLSYAWHPLYDEFKHERPSRVTIDIVPAGGHVRLTVVHDDFDDGSIVLPKISSGWPGVLSSLKSYLETGRGLHASSSRAASPAQATA
jgi:uncharacterized protein YndB with AHSA1/START domain